MIDKKKVVKAILDKDLEIFVIHILFLQALEMIIYLLQIAQIICVKLIQVTLLKQDKAPTNISNKFRFFKCFFKQKSLGIARANEP